MCTRDKANAAMDPASTGPTDRGPERCDTSAMENAAFIAPSVEVIVGLGEGPSEGRKPRGLGSATKSGIWVASEIAKTGGVTRKREGTDKGRLAGPLYQFRSRYRSGRSSRPRSLEGLPKLEWMWTPTGTVTFRPRRIVWSDRSVARSDEAGLRGLGINRSGRQETRTW